MPKILIGVLGTLGTMAVIAVIVAYGGFIDMAADTPHSPGGEYRAVVPDVVVVPREIQRCGIAA